MLGNIYQKFKRHCSAGERCLSKFARNLGFIRADSGQVRESWRDGFVLQTGIAGACRTQYAKSDAYHYLTGNR